MKGLSSKSSVNSRSQSTCSFCKNPNHQVSACPHVKPMWESLEKGIIPLAYMRNIDPNDTSGLLDTWKANHSYWTNPLSGYYTKGETWGDLYKLAQKSYEKWEKAQTRTKSKGKSSKVQTCGYCRETGHTRAKCEHLDFHKRTLVKANRNFRKWFYQEYVEKQGLSTGAIVSFDFTNNGSCYGNTPPVITGIQSIITDVNWDSINLLSMLNMDSVRVSYSVKCDGAKVEKMNNIREFLRSNVICKVPRSSFIKTSVTTNYRFRESTAFFGVPIDMCNNNNTVLLDFDSHQTIGYGNSTTNKVTNFRVVQRAPQVLSNDWINGFSDEMSVIFGKFSKAQLDYFGVIDHIKQWATKEV